MRVSFTQRKSSLFYKDNITYGTGLAKENFKGEHTSGAEREGRSPAGKARLLSLVTALGLSVGFILCGCGRESVERHSVTDTAMGTLVSMTFYSTELRQEELQDLGDAVLKEIRGLESGLLSWREETSEVFQVQKEAGAEGIPLSGELLGLLQDSQEITEASQGAFSVALGALTRLWRLDEQALKEDAEVPSKGEITAALEHCGSEKIRISEGMLFLEEGALLDLGAVGKGYALDRIREVLAEGEPEEQLAGVISLGGSVLTYGEKPDGSKWRVAVADPEHSGETIGYLELKGGWCVSTSGDYERFFEKDGVRYHHILDPATGYPAASGLRSVTVLSESGFLSDALSTACFVLGEKQGMELAEKMGVGILMVDERGEIHCNARMAEVFWDR